jgi:hypothetical protein
MKKNCCQFLAVATLASSLCGIPLFAQSTMGSAAPAQSGTMSGSKSGSMMASSSAAPTAAQIADAKAKGMVWVNTSSKVYHKSDDKFYGTTKHGQFMTEADAQKMGAHLAKPSPMGKKPAAAAAPSK